MQCSFKLKAILLYFYLQSSKQPIQNTKENKVIIINKATDIWVITRATNALTNFEDTAIGMTLKVMACNMDTDNKNTDSKDMIVIGNNFVKINRTISSVYAVRKIVSVRA